MRVLVIISVLILAGHMSASAQDQASEGGLNPYNEMQEQMRTIANTLKLDTQTIYELGQIMNEKRLAKEALLKEMEAIKVQLERTEAQASKQIQAILTPEQWQKYQAEIAPNLLQEAQDKIEKLD